MNIKYRTQLGELLNYFGLAGDAVEIGVAEGRNAEILIQHPAVTKLYLIDSWQQLNQSGDGHNPQSWHDNNFKEAQERVAPFKHKAVFLKGLSDEMIKQIPDNSLILAYIDGDHSYNGCLKDLENIYPKIKNGGVLAGHDYLNTAYGVRDAVTTFITNRLIHEKKLLKPNVIEEDETAMAGYWLIK